MRAVTSILPLLLLAACGEVSLPGAGADGGPGGDDAADAALPGPVTVEVRSFDGARAPLEGVAVGFFAADGAHQATVYPGADGLATAELAAGGAVVAFMPLPAEGGAGTRVARAVLDVAPGDHIVIAGESSPSGAPVATMTINLPAVTGAAEYVLHSSCGTHVAAGTAVTMSFFPGCDEDTFSFVAVAAGDAGRQFLRNQGAARVDGGTYNATGSWQMIPTRQFPLTELPAETEEVRAQVSSVRVGQHTIDVTLAGDSLAPVSEAAVTLRPERIPALEGTMARTEIRAEQLGLGHQIIHRWLAADDDTQLAIAGSMLPWMGPVTYQAQPPAVGWAVAGDREYDAAYLTVVASVNDEEGLRETHWSIAAPPGIQRVVLPEPPAEHASWSLPAPENVYAAGQLVDSDQIDGWDAARQLGFDPSYIPREAPVGSIHWTSHSGSLAPR